jgi:hypothetical protein
VGRVLKKAACVGTRTTWLVVASLAVIFVGACGRVAESTPPPSGETETDASVPVSLLPDPSSSPAGDDGGGWFRSHGCAISARHVPEVPTAA